MSDWLNRMVGGFYRWLRKETKVIREDDGSFVVSTPFLGLFNDVIEIWVRRESGKILLSDNGDALRCLNLAAGGEDALRDKPMAEFLEGVLLSHGAKLDRESGALLMDADKSDFPERMHDFISAMLEIHGMAAAASLFERRGALKEQGSFTAVAGKVDNPSPDAESMKAAGRQERIVGKPTAKIAAINEPTHNLAHIRLVHFFENKGEGFVAGVERKNGKDEIHSILASSRAHAAAFAPEKYS